MIGAVVLAAGESRRMGEQKLLLPFAEETVIAHIVRQVLASCVGQTVVVLGHDAAGVRHALEGFPVMFAENPHYRDGMLTSVRAGLAALSAETEAMVLCLGDQPAVTSVLIDRLVQAYREGDKGIILPLYDDDTGHPIVVSAAYKEAIMTQFDDTGLRGLIYGRPDECMAVPVDEPGALRDMDTPSDYKRELEAFGRE